MTVCEFPNNVNHNFYNYKEEYLDNAITLEYISGRKSSVKRNSIFAKKITVSLSLKVGSELNNFNNWYTVVLGGTAGVFRCSQIGEKNYRFTNPPKMSEGQIYRTCEFEIEEVI